MPPDRRRPFVEKRGNRWRVRWPDRDGNLRSASRDDEGRPFLDKSTAEGYGWEQIRLIGRGEWQDPRKSGITLADWVMMWWKIARIEELAPKSRGKYRTDIEVHIVPALGGYTLAELAEADAELAAWVTKQHADYAPSTADNRRNLLSTILGEAVRTGRMTRNPLIRSRRKGRKGGRIKRTPERAWATPLQVLLIAERAALWADGDITTFIIFVFMAYTGLRAREAVGLERRYVDRDTVRVQWQLAEQTGGLVRDAPKDDSRRTIDLPMFLAELVDVEMSGHDGVCGCTGHPGGPYVFRGGPKVPHMPSVTMDDRFRAAARSLYYSRREKRYVPVPVIGEPFPGAPTHGRRPADAMWLPVVPDAVPHSLRHSHRVWMDDDGTPDVLMHERLGHQMPGIAATYSHVSADARRRLMGALTARWEESLRQRATLNPHSPVPLLDGLLRPFREQDTVSCSRYAPKQAVTPLRSKARRPA